MSHAALIEGGVGSGNVVYPLLGPHSEPKRNGTGRENTILVAIIKAPAASACGRYPYRCRTVRFTAEGSLIVQLSKSLFVVSGWCGQ